MSDELRTSKDCWMKSSCKKYLNPNKVCECRTQDVFCIKLTKLDNLYKYSLLTENQRREVSLRYDADGTDRDVFYKLKTFKETVDQHVQKGDNLYIHSSTTGNGKTEWAIKMIQAYLVKIWPESRLECRALFINVPKLLLALKDDISCPSEYVRFIKDNVQKADLVVWDEIGAKVATQFEHDHLLNMINGRIDEGKSNIYTSNLNGDQLLERVGERLYSRIINLSQDVELKGCDKRGLR